MTLFVVCAVVLCGPPPSLLTLARPLPHFVQEGNGNEKAVSEAEKLAAARAELVTLHKDFSTRKLAAKVATVEADIDIHGRRIVRAFATLPENKRVRLSARWIQTLDGITLDNVALRSEWRSDDIESRRKTVAEVRVLADRWCGKHLDEDQHQHVMQAFDSQSDYYGKTPVIHSVDVPGWTVGIHSDSKQISWGVDVK